MRKLCCLLAAILCCLQLNVAFADHPSPQQMLQSRVRRNAELLEREGIAIANLQTAFKENNGLNLHFELYAPRDGALECFVITADDEKIVGECKKLLTSEMRMAKSRDDYLLPIIQMGGDKFLVSVPLDTAKLFAGRNTLEVKCKYQISYEPANRLGGGYAWFKDGRPARGKNSIISIVKEVSKKIALLKTSTRYLMYEI